MTDRNACPAAIALREQKQALRQRVLAERALIEPAEHRRLSERLAAGLLDLPEVSGARCVLAYLSFGSEVGTSSFIDGVRARGCALVLPRIDLARHRLNLHRVGDPDADTVAGVWGIREPDPARCTLADTSEIDVVLVPGVAFTPRCERMGYGGGFYDALIREWPQPPPLIAAAFDLQLVDELPSGPDDWPIDMVITPSRSYRRSAELFS